MTARLIMKMKVVGIAHEPNNVAVYTLSHTWRDKLSDPLPGAHVDVSVPGGKVRQYSLCGDPDDASIYRIAVKHEESGRGASKWIHENFKLGDVVLVSTPRNNFPLDPEAARHILIAGGIGITPFIAWRVGLRSRKRSSRCTIAHDRRMRLFLRSCVRFAAIISSRIFPTCRKAGFNAAKALQGVSSDTHVYFCGPQKLTDAVREATSDWPEERVHFEVFAPTLDENFNPEPFDIVLASSGNVLRVPADKSALDVLRAQGFALPSSCELGVCGSCACNYRDGIVDPPRFNSEGIRAPGQNAGVCLACTRKRYT